VRARHHAPTGWTLAIFLTTSKGRLELKRSGFARESDATRALAGIRELTALAGPDKRALTAIGDLIWESTSRCGELPPTEDVRRRLALGRDLSDPDETFGEAWRAWLAGKRKTRPSWLRNLTLIGDHWLLPVLEHMPITRIGGEQCAAVFERIASFNDEIAAAAEVGRAPFCPEMLAGSLSWSASRSSIASMPLFALMNFQVRRWHVIPFNPVFVVELEAEERAEANRWTAAEARRFLAATAGDQLGLMFRIVVLRGARRGEAVGFRSVPTWTLAISPLTGRCCKSAAPRPKVAPRVEQAPGGSGWTNTARAAASPPQGTGSGAATGVVGVAG